ncbi:MAG: sugar porter family MFS transporter [Polyangiaceae bacterium]
MNNTVQRGGRRAFLVAYYTYSMTALSGLLFGMDIGAISGANELIQRDFQISDRTIERIVSAMLLGAAVGALAGGRLCAVWGRKRSLVIGGALLLAGSIWSGAAWSAGALIGARLVLGLGVGITSLTTPLYLAEVSASKHRGALVSLYQLMITAGIFLAFLLDLAFSRSGSWRWMLGVIAFPAALFTIGTCFVVESPRWLMMQGRREEALRALGKLRGGQPEEAEMAGIEQHAGQAHEGLRLLRDNRDFRRSVGLGALLQVMQQLTGINLVMYYAPRIFHLMGYGTRAQLTSTAAIGLTNMLATLIAIALVDRWGRKPMLYIGFTAMAVSLGLVGFMLHQGVSTRAEQIFTAGMVLTFVTGFAMSAGPVIWAVCSEVPLQRGRDFGVSLSTCANWLTNTLIGATFLTSLSRIGAPTTFWIFASLNLLFVFVTFALVPETRGVSLEEIERNLSSGKPLRHIGR